MEKFNVVIASDSFKGSLSSREVAESMIKGFNEASNLLEYKVFQIADGGEGTVEAITNNLGGEVVEFEVLDVFRRKTKAILGVLDDSTCILETASPCGLDKIDETELNPMKATSFGLGQMIIHALDKGFKKIYIGLGGSSVNDGGIGLAKALGVKVIDSNMQEVDDGAIGLSQVAHIDLENLDPRLSKISVILLSDVKNILTGKDGATAVYGPQKGIEADQVEIVDSWMHSYGVILSEATGKDVLNMESSGAAGGLGAILIALTNAEIRSGIEAIIDILKIEDAVKSADIVFTGEGRMDGQSLNGKAPLGIANLAHKYGTPMVAIVGSKSEDYTNVLERGIDVVFDIIDKPLELCESVSRAEEFIKRTAFSAMKLFLSWKNKLKNN